MARSNAFPRSHRLAGRVAFSAVFDGGMRHSRGFLTMYALPNQCEHARFGITIGRKVGTAVRRNLIKRRLRETFRHMQHDLPQGYDMVVVVRPHEPVMLADYQRLLMGMALKLHAAWQQR